MTKKTSSTKWTRKHLLGLEDLSAAEILTLLDKADGFFPFCTGRRPAPQTLKGRTVLNLFVEDSTRTRTSFTLAAERLGARVFQFHAATSSLNKKESLSDTVRNIDAMGLDAIVIRHPERGAPQRVAEVVDGSVFNAGDDAHEHPTQGLLDMMTIRRRLGRLENLTLALVGDVRHSRVARSNLFGLSKFKGNRIVFVGPPMFTEDLDVRAETTTDFDSVLPECDAVMMLRVQFERHESIAFNVDEYIRGYQLTPCAPGPGPQGRHRPSPRAGEPRHRAHP